MKYLVVLALVLVVLFLISVRAWEYLPETEKQNEATTVCIDVEVNVDIEHENRENRVEVSWTTAEATTATTNEPVTTESATVATTTETTTEATTEAATAEATTECAHLFDGKVLGYDGINDLEKIWCSHGCGTYCIRKIPDLCIRVDALEDRFIITVTGGLHPGAKVYVNAIEVKIAYLSHSRYEYTGFVMLDDLGGEDFEIRAYDVSEHRKAVASYDAKGEMIE